MAKKWYTEKDGTGEIVKYSLKREANPIWFAVVYANDARWTFRIGTRVKEGEKQTIYHATKSWKTLDVAKRKSLDAIYNQPQ